MTTTDTTVQPRRGAITPMHLALMAAVRVEHRAAVDFANVTAYSDDEGLHVDLALDSTTWDDSEDTSAWRAGLDAAHLLGLTEVGHGHGWTEWAGHAEHADVTLTAYYEDDQPVPLRLRLLRLRNHRATPVLALAASAAAGAALALAARRIVQVPR